MTSVSVEFTVVDETEFVDRTDPSKPVEKVLVTYQDVSGRVGSLSLPKAGYTKDVRNRAIADLIKKSPARPFERVKV